MTNSKPLDKLSIFIAKRNLIAFFLLQYLLLFRSLLFVAELKRREITNPIKRTIPIIMRLDTIMLAFICILSFLGSKSIKYALCAIIGSC